MPSRYGKIFSISPSEGFVRPQEEVSLTVAFHPTRDRVMDYKKAERAAAARRSLGTLLSGLRGRLFGSGGGSEKGGLQGYGGNPRVRGLREDPPHFWEVIGASHGGLRGW